MSFTQITSLCLASTSSLRTNRKMAFASHALPIRTTVSTWKRRQESSRLHSRHPCSTESSDQIEDYVNYVCNFAVPKTITLDEVRQHTSTYTVIQAVTRAVKTGRWNDARVSNFRNVQNELTTSKGIVLRETRIVAALQAKAVELAHVCHQGIVKTKKLLRKEVWFPGIDCTALHRTPLPVCLQPKH